MRPSPCWNGSKMLVRKSSGTPGPGVLNDEENAAILSPSPHPDGGPIGRVTGRVDDETLEDTFDLRSVDFDHGSICLHVKWVVALQFRLHHDPVDQVADVGGRKPRLRDPPCQAVDVQEIREDLVEPFRIGDHPVDELSPLLTAQNGTRLFECHGASQHGRERSSELMRHCREESGLQLVKGA